MKINSGFYKTIFIISLPFLITVILLTTIAMKSNAYAAEDTDHAGGERMLVCLKILEENRIEYETLSINFNEKNFRCRSKKNSILIYIPEETQESKLLNLVPFELKHAYDINCHIPDLKIASFYLSRPDSSSETPVLDARSFAPLNNYTEESGINFADARFISFEKKVSVSEGGTWHPSYEKRCVAKPDFFEKKAEVTHKPIEDELGEERSKGLISITGIFGDKIKNDLDGAKKVKYSGKLRPHDEAVNETDGYCWNITREFGRFEAFMDARFNFSNQSSWSVRHKTFKVLNVLADGLFKNINLEKKLIRRIKKAFPDADDAFASPCKKFLVILLNNNIYIFKNNDVFGKHLFKYRIRGSGRKCSIKVISLQKMPENI